MKNHKKLYCLLFFITFTSIINLIFIITIFNDDLVDKIHANNLKAVQLLTTRFIDFNWHFKSLGLYPFKNCPESRCYAFHSNNIFYKPEEKSDAVVVHAPNLLYMPSRNYNRNPKQLWMFYSMEPQRLSFCSSHLKLTDLDYWFNLTATFKTDSEIPLNYRDFNNWSDIEVDENYLKNYKPFSLKSIESKVAKVVWIVSHCNTNSRRENYVKELSKYINVEIYGKCSKKKFCQSKKDKNCLQTFLNKYKFLLAFENSLCDDYISEKFWRNYAPDFLYDVNIVPVVRGAKETQYKKFVPFDKFYINSNNFNSPKDLADYLNYLNVNSTAYAEYFKWKIDLLKRIENNVKSKNKRYLKSSRNILNENEAYMVKEPFCKLCEYLHNSSYLNNHANNKQWKISEWFNHQTNCWDYDEKIYNLDKVFKFFGFCI